MNKLDLRIRRLEGECRVYRTLFGFAGLILLAFLTYGATKTHPDVIRANRFEAVNENGRIGAGMAVFRGHGDGVFRAFNRDGVEVFYAGSSRTGDGRVEIKSRKGRMTEEITGERK